MLKVDRTVPRTLHVVEDQFEYSPRQIQELLLMIGDGNPTKDGVGLSRVLSTFGLVGKPVSEIR